MIRLSPLESLAKETDDFIKSAKWKNYIYRLVGIIFCQPIGQPADESDVPQNSRFHFSSGKQVRLFFLGESGAASKNDAHESLRIFKECREHLLTDSSHWTPRQGCEFFLFDATLDPSSNTAELEIQTDDPSEYLKEREFSAGGVQMKRVTTRILKFCEHQFDLKHIGEGDESKKTKSSPSSASSTTDQFVDREYERMSEAAKIASQIRTDFEQTIKGLKEALAQIPLVDAERLEKCVTKLAAEVDQVHSATKAIKEVIEPITGMYVEPRMADVRSKSVREKVPDWIVDMIVKSNFTHGFPSKGDLFKELTASGGLKKLDNAGLGSSVATIARWLGVVRKHMQKNGFVEKRSIGKGGLARSMERYNPEYRKHQKSYGEPEAESPENESGGDSESS